MVSRSANFFENRFLKAVTRNLQFRVRQCVLDRGKYTFYFLLGFIFVSTQLTADSKTNRMNRIAPRETIKKGADANDDSFWWWWPF